MSDIPTPAPPTIHSPLLNLASMSAFLSDRFQSDIAYMTPYDWWWRRRDIEPPFPKPAMKIGRSNLFDAEEVAEWYGKFKGVKEGK